MRYTICIVCASPLIFDVTWACVVLSLCAMPCAHFLFLAPHYAKVMPRTLIAHHIGHSAYASSCLTPITFSWASITACVVHIYLNTNAFLSHLLLSLLGQKGHILKLKFQMGQRISRLTKRNKALHFQRLTNCMDVSFQYILHQPNGTN